MAKNSVADWSTVASENTDIAGVNINENCLPSGMNNAVRAVMAQAKAGFGDEPNPTFATRDAASEYDLSAFSVVTISRWSSTSPLAPAKYAKVEAEPTHAAKFQDDSGNWWGLAERVVNVLSLGATGNGTDDDTTAIRNAIRIGRDVFFPVPDNFYRITDEIGPKFPGQTLFANTRVRGMIRNLTNSNRLAVFGDIASNSGAVPQASMVNLMFFGNPLTTGGIWLPTPNSPGANPAWADASKDCQVIGCGVDRAGDGFTLQIHSWENEVVNFTAYENNDMGVELGVDANNNNLAGIYITDCDGVSLHIHDVGTGRISRGNTITALTVQQSGPDDVFSAAVVIEDAANTTIRGIYFESNNAKGATRSMYIAGTAAATVVEGVNHLSGGSGVISNDGVGTVIQGVTSTGVTGNIVEVVSANASGLITGVVFEPGSITSGNLVGGAGLAGSQTVWVGGKTFYNDLSIASFAPSLDFVDRSGSSGDFRMHADANIFQMMFDAGSDGTFEQGLWSFNPLSSTPEMVLTGRLRSTQYTMIADGVATPALLAGFASIYVDTADGDLKVRFGDGIIKTLATDS